MFGGASDWFGKAKAAVAEASSTLQSHIPSSALERLEKLKAMEDEDAKPVEDTDGGDKPPWEDTPAKWVGREREWRMLAEGICLDDGTFLFGPERGLAKEEGRVLKENGVAVDFLFERDVMEMLKPSFLESKDLSSARYRLVPRWTTEESFWRNYLWKVRELGKLDDVQVQGRLLLGTINSQRSDLPAGPSPSQKPLPDSAVDPEQRRAALTAVIARVCGELEEREEREQHARRHTELLQLHEEAQEALRLLRECMQVPTDDIADVMSTAYEACLGFQSRIHRALADPPSGEATSAFARMADLGVEIDTVISEYEARSAAEPAAAPTLPPEPETVSELVAAPSQPAEHPVPTTAPAPATASPPTAPPASESDFQKLPWEEDDDDD